MRFVREIAEKKLKRIVGRARSAYQDLGMKGSNKIVTAKQRLKILGIDPHINVEDVEHDRFSILYAGGFDEKTGKIRIYNHPFPMGIHALTHEMAHRGDYLRRNYPTKKLRKTAKEMWENGTGRESNDEELILTEYVARITTHSALPISTTVKSAMGRILEYPEVKNARNMDNVVKLGRILKKRAKEMERTRLDKEEIIRSLIWALSDSKTVEEAVSKLRDDDIWSMFKHLRQAGINITPGEILAAKQLSRWKR